jgi:hypothetical protein
MGWGTGGWLQAGLAVAVVGALGLGYWVVTGKPAQSREAAAAQRSELGRASAALLAPALPGVELELSLAQVQSLRPKLRAHPLADLDGLTAYHEQLAPDLRALYFFTPVPARLARVQLASKLAGDEAVVAHVLDLQARLGAPSAVWDCPPAPENVPTRRYQFRRGPVAALDIIALLGERASATFYVAAAPQIRSSLQQARCQPTPPERAARFPAVPSTR